MEETTVGRGEDRGAERLRRQIEFVVEADKLKNVLRQTYLADGSRHENSGEHSWHLALMAVVLAEHANEPVDLGRVLRMLIVHDIVEIDAGDTFCYDAAGGATQDEREARAAERIFGLLPDDQAVELRELWQEFEARQTPEARFSAALDRLMPLLHNLHTQGGSWREHDIGQAQVVARGLPIAEGSEALWELAQSVIAESMAKKYLRP